MQLVHIIEDLEKLLDEDTANVKDKLADLIEVYQKEQDKLEQELSPNYDEEFIGTPV